MFFIDFIFTAIKILVLLLLALALLKLANKSQSFLQRITLRVCRLPQLRDLYKTLRILLRISFVFTL